MPKRRKKAAKKKKAKKKAKKRRRRQLLSTFYKKTLLAQYLPFFVFFVFLFKNLLPNIGERVRATNEDTTIAKVKEIAVSLNNVPDIPSIKIKGKKTAIKTKVVEIIAKVTLLEPLTAATNGVSPFSIR